MSLKLLAKKHADRVLSYLKEHGESHFGQIKTDLNIEQSTLSKLLTELVEEDYLSKREEKEGYKLPKTYYKLTDIGNNALKIYFEYEKLEKMKESKFKMEIKGGKNTNIQTENLDLKIEYK